MFSPHDCKRIEVGKFFKAKSLMIDIITVGQVRSKSIILYDQFQGSFSRKEKSAVRQSNIEIQRKKAYSGNITTGSRKRLRKAIDLMVQSIQPKWIYNEVSGHPHLHKLSFITLTISETERNIDSNEARKLLLKPFLQWLTRTQGVTLYIWKAELQKRGQLHYHITTPSYVRYDLIKQKWNQLQQKHGLLNNYYQKKGHYNANSTDIHEVYKVKDVAAYLMKYLEKEVEKAVKQDQEKQGIKKSSISKVWDCSAALKKADYFKIEESTITRERIKSLLSENKIELYNADRCSVIKMVNCKPTDILTKNERRLYDLHMEAIRKGYSDSQETQNQSTINPAESLKQYLNRCQGDVKQNNPNNVVKEAQSRAPGQFATLTRPGSGVQDEANGPPLTSFAADGRSQGKVRQGSLFPEPELQAGY